MTVKTVIREKMYCYILLEHFPDLHTGISYYDEGDHCKVFTDLFGKGHHINHSTWCQEFSEKFQLEVAGTYGIEADKQVFEVYYQIAAILVPVPEWGEYRQGCVLYSHSPGSSG